MSRTDIDGSYLVHVPVGAAADPLDELEVLLRVLAEDVGAGPAQGGLHAPGL